MQLMHYVADKYDCQQHNANAVNYAAHPVRTRFKCQCCRFTYAQSCNKITTAAPRVSSSLVSGIVQVARMINS